MKKMLILFSSLLIIACTSNESIDGIYEIRISDKSVSEAKNLTDNWFSTIVNEKENVDLFQCLNDGYEYGHVTISNWDDLEQLKKIYNLKNKPDDKLHRAYKKIGEVKSSKTIGDFYVITVFKPDHNLLSDTDLQPYWDLMSDWMKNQPGFVNANFYKSISRDATYKYISIANWNSLIDASNIIRGPNLFNEITENNRTILNKKSNFYSKVQLK